MTEKEIDIVAEELARLGGNAWYPGRSNDPVLRVVTERYRERARAAVAALDRYRNSADTLRDATPEDAISVPPCSTSAGRLRIGATVIYRPPGDRRAYSCIVDQVTEGAVHLVPQIAGWDGWLRDAEFLTESVVRDLRDQSIFAPEGGVVPSLQRS